ncbi:MAG: MFS transporter [Anaerolineales bacterium]
MQNQSNGYKWYILALVVLTNMFVTAMPAMGMSVLAKEISQDLGLNIVQVGVIWGIGSMPAIFTSLLGGGIGDKLGPKRVLVASSLIAGLLGAARGVVSSYHAMLLVVVLLGGLIPFVSMNGIKIAGQWFPSSQLGLANGLISMGMALGFLLGSMLSATFLSPFLGGWRNVMIVYGIIGALFSIPWVYVRTSPLQNQKSGEVLSLRVVIRQVVKLKNVWLLAFTMFGVGGSIQSILGYLPIYLRNIGWNAVQADGVLTAFHTASLIFVMPIALWSDRLRSRKWLLLATGLMVMLGVGLLSIARGNWVWVAVLMVGFVRDGFMAILLTMIIEVNGVGPAYAGTALGFVMAIGGLANTIAPPLGNSLAKISPSHPFMLWAVWAFFGVICLFLFKERAFNTQQNTS